MAIAAVLLLKHDAGAGAPLLAGAPQAAAGAVAGLAIGAVASLLGVAGGELLIPTLVLLYGADVKLAGSLSLAVSLPTMLVGFTRYSRDCNFAVLGRSRGFALAMAAGSVAGSFAGGRLLGIVPAPVLLPLLAAILLVSAIKILGQGWAPAPCSTSWKPAVRWARAPSGSAVSGIARVVAGIEAEKGRRLPRQRKTQRGKLGPF